eukprot:7288329-Prorocentrum_lima.AAC.1
MLRLEERRQSAPALRHLLAVKRPGAWVSNLPVILLHELLEAAQPGDAWSMRCLRCRDATEL